MNADSLWGKDAKRLHETGAVGTILLTPEQPEPLAPRALEYYPLKGTIMELSPADAMSALDPAFYDAYAKATDALFRAVLDFEKTTGRIVENIELQNIDITQVQDISPRYLRQARIQFLPILGETGTLRLNPLQRCRE